ncbi:hypothetical protein [Caballeronia sordidicola]|uniref:Zinc-ribbon domain-containing protein n=1 Tax=Caballeronia sordidicola TaxID=196367 RepID=A0A226WYP6_CABSO|nr:hypothetical protein [Caballeronia sordidicola]OXC76336.1 hypothetical protein BSU04_22025 [Caballeronia sordidicola]
MDDQKSKHPLEREALMALAARYRADRALAFETLETADAGWQCGRGHAWDDAVSAAQNVRCMNCAAQRREQHTERLKALAEERGGRLLSVSYVDAATPLRWECAFGHGWDAQADVATRRWCTECMRRGVYDALTPHLTEEGIARDCR